MPGDRGNDFANPVWFHQEQVFLNKSHFLIRGNAECLCLVIQLWTKWGKVHCMGEKIGGNIKPKEQGAPWVHSVCSVEPQAFSSMSFPVNIFTHGFEVGKWHPSHLNFLATELAEYVTEWGPKRELRLETDWNQRCSVKFVWYNKKCRRTVERCVI